MLLTFLEKLGGLFDSRFIITFWMPAFLFMSVLFIETALLYDYAGLLQWWEDSGATVKTLTGGAFLISVTVLAYMLQAISFPLVRLFVGYWPSWLSWFKKWAVAREKKVFDGISTDIESYYNNFSPFANRIQPTRLGNVLTAAYDYPEMVYGIKGSVWWSRLTPIMPEAFRTQVDSALASLLTMVNLCTLSFIAAFISGMLVAWLDYRQWLFLVVLGIGLLSARICYNAAIVQAGNYGEHIRVGFDLYRKALMEQMRVPLPDTGKEEFQKWRVLNEWTRNYIKPWTPTDSNVPRVILLLILISPRRRS